MRSLIFFDDHLRDRFLPLVFTRPICELRLGIFTIREKWLHLIEGTDSCKTVDYLIDLFPFQSSSDDLWINARFLPSPELAKEASSLSLGEAIIQGNHLICARLSNRENTFDPTATLSPTIKTRTTTAPCIELLQSTDVFKQNEQATAWDYEQVSSGRQSATLSSTNTLLHPENIFIEPGAKAECCTFNAEHGPIYIGRNTQIMEGSHIRGPFVLCEGATVKMGAKIYGGTTIGPHSKVGGELSNVVIQGYSNKGHDGYLGNSVIGEWCNIGAGSNSSNLKNTYSSINLWDYESQSYQSSGLRFCGLIMGDHTKCGINATLNTGTTIGVSANLFGSKIQPKHIPSFSWGGGASWQSYQLPKAIEVAKSMMARRGKTLSVKEEKLLTTLFDMTKNHQTN